MKSSCKQIDITDVNTILPWVGECIDRHKKRHDFEKLLLTVGGMTKEDYRKAVNGDLSLLEEPKRRIAEEAAKRIKERNLKLAPVVIQYRRDKSSLKLRQIGRESAMQQIFDYIAIRSCEEIWNRRIVPQQASSIRNRGQVYGTATISSWVQRDNRAAEYAKEHGYRYSRKCKHHVKLDVKQCYPSLRTDIAETWLQRVEDAGYYVMLYSSASWLGSKFDMTRLKSFDVWCAAYVGAKANISKYYTGNYGIWQYSSSVILPTVYTSRLDQDYAYKDYAKIITSKKLNNLK